jgi:hypothetical protein
VEHNKKNQRILRHTGGTFSQAVIEGEIALPVGKPEMERLLLVRGRAETGSVESLDQRAMTDGTLTLCVCYLDADEQLQAFESVSTFKHTADVKGAQAGMRGSAAAYVSDIETAMTDSRRINIQAVIDIFFSIMDEVDFAYLAPSSEEGLVYKTKTLSFEKRCARATTAAEITGETVLSAGTPGVMQVLDCHGQAVVQQAFGENDLLCVEGELRLAIAYATDAPQTPIAQCYTQIPFSQMLAAPGTMEDQRVSAQVKVKDLFARGSEDGDAIIVRAVCAIELEAQQSVEIDVVEDAYALGCAAKVQTMPVHIGRCAAEYAGVEAVREVLALEDVENVDRILAVFATPSAARATAGEGSLTVESVMGCQIVYVDHEGKLLSQSAQWPVSLEMTAPACTKGCEPIVQMHAEQAQAALTAEGADVRVLVNFQAQIMQADEALIAEQITLAPSEDDKGLEGIMVYFTGEGEMLWDIAKRYRIAPQDVLRYNQDVQEPFSQGQRLILLCRSAG